MWWRRMSGVGVGGGDKRRIKDKEKETKKWILHSNLNIILWINRFNFVIYLRLGYNCKQNFETNSKELPHFVQTDN